MEDRCNLSLNTKCSCGKGGWGGGDVDDRSQWVPDWQVDKRKAGWCVGVGVGVVAGERGRERE